MAGSQAWAEVPRSVREELGYVSSLIWALRQLGFEVAKPQRLLVLGARSGMEGWLAAKNAFDQLSEAFPVPWSIDLVGPEMETDTWSSALEVRGFRMKGHDYLREHEPDLVAPGLGIHRNSMVSQVV